MWCRGVVVGGGELYRDLSGDICFVGRRGGMEPHGACAMMHSCGVGTGFAIVGGSGPLKAETRVRIPIGPPTNVGGYLGEVGFRNIRMFLEPILLFRLPPPTIALRDRHKIQPPV